MNAVIARAENVAHVDREDEVVLALLPSGPIRILQGPAVLVWDELLEGSLRRPDLVKAVLSYFPDHPAEAVDQLGEVVDELVAEGFLRLVPQATVATPEAS